MPTESHDPYRKWLGIPAGKRLPTRYHLLRVSLDEQGQERTRSAAERQRSHVAKSKDGPHQGVATGMLKEADEAELTLLAPGLRGESDLFRRRTRQQVGPFPAATKLQGGRRPVINGRDLPDWQEFRAVLLPECGRDDSEPRFRSEPPRGVWA